MQAIEAHLQTLHGDHCIMANLSLHLQTIRKLRSSGPLPGLWKTFYGDTTFSKTALLILPVALMLGLPKHLAHQARATQPRKQPRLFPGLGLRPHFSSEGHFPIPSQYPRIYHKKVSPRLLPKQFRRQFLQRQHPHRLQGATNPEILNGQKPLLLDAHLERLHLVPRPVLISPWKPPLWDAASV